MKNPYAKEMNAFMEMYWRDKLEDNGFFPLRDCTEFVRIQDGNLMQIILCSGYAMPEILFYSQTLSEYMWCNYRNQVDMTAYAGNNYAYAAVRYDQNHRFLRREDDLNVQVAYALDVLNAIHTPQDILARNFEKERSRYGRPCLWYEAGDIEGTWKAVKNSTWGKSPYYNKDVPPEKLKRDYWRSWMPLQAFAARECLAKDSLQPLADFAKRSREFNIKYIQRYMPWLLK